MSSIEIRNVTKSYGALQVLHGIDLNIMDEEFVVLVGPSGCGKSTLLRMIAGLEEISGGDVLIDGDRINDVSPQKRDLAMVFQSYALFPHMSVIENVSYGLRFSGHPKGEIRGAALDGLALVGLADFADRLPSELSGGQQQRVAVARALVLKPQVLLFDEPLSNLDAKLRRQVREEIREIQQTLGLTVVYVTHDQEEALAVSDIIVVMRNAAIAQIGTPRELYDAPADRFVADFIGEANLVDCTIKSVDGEMAMVDIAGYNYRLASRGLGVGTATMAVRPSRIILSRTASADGLEVTVVKATYVGSRMEYTVSTPIGDLFAVMDDVYDPIDVGQQVTLQFAETGPVLLPE